MYGLGTTNGLKAFVEDPLNGMLDGCIEHVRQRRDGGKTKL